MSCFCQLAHEIGIWGDITFPRSTPESVMEHMLLEIDELYADPTDGQEMADVLMLLLHLAHKQGLNLQEELEKKFAVNKARKWGKPNANGVVEHIREEPVAES